MNCERANELMVLELYGEAGAADAAELKSHLAACAACRQAAEATRAALEEFRRELAPQPSREAVERILEAAQPRPGILELLRRLRPALLQAAAVVVIALGISFTIKFWPQRPAVPTPTAVASATEASPDSDSAWSANIESVVERIRLAKAGAGFDASLDYRIASLHDTLTSSGSDW
ncbi:MAG: zf-HC2 domain-containing protein [Verrucomicrobia bacterium]|nr:zf-HC2 domain-containing protein [Verrucomicrobiota bacterium]